MKLAEFSVAHPVSIAMLIVILTSLGAISMFDLPMELFPEIEFPMITVTTEYEGVAPEEVEERVTKPVEQAVAAVEQVKSIRSVSREGSSEVYIEFYWGADTDILRIDVREKLDRIRSALPDDSEDPIVTKLAFGGDAEAIRVAISSETVPLAEVRRLAEEIMKPRFESIDDVATAQVRGGYERELHVYVIPRRMDSYGLTLGELAAALSAENLNQPGGRIERGREEFLVRTLGKFRSLEEIRRLVVANRDGALVTLGDVAEIRDTHKEVRALSRFNGLETVEITVLKEAQGNAVAISDAVHAKVEALSGEYPQLELGVAFDSAPYIRMSVLTVRENAAWGALFAILVLWPFLSRRRLGTFAAIAATGLGLLLADSLGGRLVKLVGPWGSLAALAATLGFGGLLVRLLWRSSRATLIVSLAIPISVVATFILIKFAGLSLNVISLGGLALGVGMLVDNSVVVVENIARQMDLGKPPARAAVDGASEVTLAIVVSTFTTLAVFLPIAWIEGIAKEVFNDLSLTVCFSLLTSLLVAISIVPMLAAKFLRSEALSPPEHGITAEQEIASLHRPQARLRQLVLGLLARRRRIAAVLGTATAAFALALVALALYPKGYFPSSDRDTFAIRVKMPRGTAFPAIDAVVRRVEQAVMADRDAQSVFASVRPERSTVGVTLRADRSRHSEDVQNDLREQFRSIPDAEILVFTFHSGMGARPVSVEILGDDLARLAEISDTLAGHLREIEGVLDVRSSTEEGRPELQVAVDRLRAADYGLSVRQIADEVETAVDGRVVGRYVEEGKEIEIRLQYHPRERSRLENLRDLPLRRAVGVAVSLKDLAEIRSDRGPVRILRKDQRRLVSVDAEKDRERALGRIAAQLQSRMAAVPLPVGYLWRFGGDEEFRTEAFAGLGISLGIAIVLVYMIMAALFESLIQPFVIMLSLPLAIIGVVLGLVALGQELSVPAYVGIIILAGIVVNNAIVLVDYVNRLRRRGLERPAALALASAVRMRPVLMTAGTTVLGMLPMALGIGRGAKVFQGLATAVIGGLAISTLLTLVVVPCAYDALDRLAARLRRAGGRIGLDVRDPFAAERQQRSAPR